MGIRHKALRRDNEVPERGDSKKLQVEKKEVYIDETEKEIHTTIGRIDCDLESENSSVDLVDKAMLDKCVEDTWKYKQKGCKEREGISSSYKGVETQQAKDTVVSQELGKAQIDRAIDVGKGIAKKKMSEDRQIKKGINRGEKEGKDEGKPIGIREEVQPYTKAVRQELVIKKMGEGNKGNILSDGKVGGQIVNGGDITSSRSVEKEEGNRQLRKGSRESSEEGGTNRREIREVGEGRILENIEHTTLVDLDRTQAEKRVKEKKGREEIRKYVGEENNIKVAGDREEVPSETYSECSSIDLIDRHMLNKCLQQGREIEESEKAKKAEVDNEEYKRIESRELTEEGVFKAVGREDSNREEGDRNNYRNNSREGYINEEGEEEDGSVLEMQSERSSIELLDRITLDRCIQQCKGIEYEEWRVEEEILDTIGGRIGEEELGIGNRERGATQLSQSSTLDRLREIQGGGISQDNRISMELIRKGLWEGMENTGEINTEESKSTTSSIAVLFRNTHLEREGKKMGRKNITRRKVWVRWKGVVRGVIRRDTRRKKKLDRKGEKQGEDKKLVFDYTTRGLSVDEVKLLGKGEAFCVVDYKIDEDRSKVDIYQYQRRLRLHELFRDPGVREEDEIEGLHTPTGRDGDQLRRQERERENNTERRGGERVLHAQGRGGRQSILSIVGRGDRGTGRRSVQSRGERGSVVSGRQYVDRHTTRDNGGGERVINTQRREGRDSISRTRGRGRNTTGRGRTQGSRESMVNRETLEKGKGEGRRLPSMYDPDSHNRNLNRYNTCIQEEIMLALEDKKVKFRDNVPKEERVALRLLKQRIERKEIIITRADKGSGLVAVDYDKYICKGTKYIEEEAGAYSKVLETEHKIIDRLTKERNKIAEQLKDRGVIEGQTATYIKKQLEDKITGIKFYYKIHKDRQIDSMPLRPLQSCIKAPMQHLSIVLTDILQPLLIDKNIPSFIFDSNQLLYRLRKLGKIPRNCTLISSDVSALYLSIPHVEGFRAVRGFLQEFTMYNTQQIGSIIRALELVITENYMIWNSQIYKQTSGVAMGTPVAVAYANIFMNWVDREVRKKAPYIYEHIRYIDDNLFILPKDKVKQLMEIANNILPPHIKFTYEKLDASSGKGLPFLDTQLFIGVDNSIESRLYTKATDRHAYLLPSSYHPPHVTKNILLAVFGRLRKICSREEWFVEDVQKAEGWLESRGYKREEIQKAVAKIKLKDRWKMIEKIENNREKEAQKKEQVDIDIPLIMTYNQHVKKIREVLKNRQPLLDSAFRRTKVRPRLSFRRKRNLNDMIIQKSLRGPIEQNRKELNIFTKCGERPGYRTRCPCKGKHSQEVCRCCVHSKGVMEGIEYKLFKPVSCNSRNIIYVIGCKKCSKRYVGETQQRLKDRLAQHMYNVDKLNQPLYLHFRHIHKLESLYIEIVETVRGVEPFMRKVREAWWINQLKTLEPSGFNVKLECN